MEKGLQLGQENRTCVRKTGGKEGKEKEGGDLRSALDLMATVFIAV